MSTNLRLSPFRALLLVGLTAGCEAAEMSVDGLSGAFDPGSLDSDGDGVSDADEEAMGTDPNATDSDEDGWDDTEEISGNTDPTNADDHPYQGGWPIGDCRNDLQGTTLAQGEVAPQFELTDSYGDTVRLHDFCHMAVLVVTGAEWCGPCQAYRAEAAGYYEEYYGRGLMIIDFLGEDSGGQPPTQEVLERWRDGHPYAVLGDPNWAVSNTGYVSGGIPAISLIAPGGVVDILNGYPGPSDIERVLPAGFQLPGEETEEE